MVGDKVILLSSDKKIRVIKRKNGRYLQQIRVRIWLTTNEVHEVIGLILERHKAIK